MSAPGATDGRPLGANVTIGTGKTLVVDGPVAINSGGTLGVNSGYSQADVTEFARALTGWPSAATMPAGSSRSGVGWR